MNNTMYQPLPYNQMPPFQCIIIQKFDIQSPINKDFIMFIFAIGFSIIKSYTYWDCTTLQAPRNMHVCFMTLSVMCTVLAKCLVL